MYGYLITRKEIMAKNNEPMEFVSFEDETDIYDVVIFPDVYRKFCQHLDSSTAFLLRGRVVSDSGAVQIEVRNIAPLS